jgi:hypothetical protein
MGRIHALGPQPLAAIRKNLPPPCRFARASRDYFAEDEIMITMLKNAASQTLGQTALAELFAGLSGASLRGPRSEPGYEFILTVDRRRTFETPDQRRRRMIRDTERYLNDPRSAAWERL